MGVSAFLLGKNMRGLGVLGVFLAVGVAGKEEGA
jgi:hypothetical protein